MQLFNSQLNLTPLSQTGFHKPGLEEQQAKLKDQVDEFAGLLFGQLVREMREAGKSADEESLFGGGDSSYFMHLFDQEVGKALVHQNGGGLKDALYHQLSSRLTAESQAKGDSQ